MPRSGLKVLVAAKLHANQLERHLELFERIDEVERVIVVRHEPIPERLSKIENHSFERGNRIAEAVRMVRTINSLVRREGVDWVVGFNPVPWGSLALLAARPLGVPTCLSLIGMDFRQVQTRWGRPFLEAVRRADAVTVTGARMTDVLVSLGVAPEKIRILPHSVDIERFAPNDGPKQFDLISVGQLIRRKRMDVTLDALSLLKNRGRRVTLGILGRGELATELEGQAQRLGIADQVTFLGYRDNVERLIGAAKLFCLVSEWEGVPFAMMEAMAAGVPPIVTDVGTIGDWVSDGDNGRIVPVGDAHALSEAIDDCLKNDEAQLCALRERLLAQRERLGFESGARVWRDILGLGEASRAYLTT